MCLGIPGEIVEVREDQGLRMGKVRFGGIIREVCLECQPEAGAGDFVLVHVGFAIARIDADQALRAWEILEVFGQTAELEGAPDSLGAGPAAGGFAPVRGEGR